MIVIFSALYFEAEALIDKLQLKQVPILKGYTCFFNDMKSIAAVITGTGKINAAAAVSAFLQKYACDHLIMFSSCAGLKEQKPSDTYLIHQVSDLETGRFFYPDLLERCSLPEASLLCGEVPLGKKSKNRDVKSPYDPEEILKDDSFQKYDLYDMDSYGIALISEKYLGPHQIHLIKVVTDNGNQISADTFRTCMRAGAEKVFPYIQLLESLAGEEKKDNHDIDRISEEMHCSVTMKAQLEQLYRYADAAKIPIYSYLHQLYIEKLLPCSSREEGKKVLHELTERITA